MKTSKRRSNVPKIVVIGEVLVDLFGDTGKGLADSKRFTPRFGGAPANLAVSAAKIGGDVGFVGRVGTDGFGDGISAFLSATGIDTTYLIKDPDRATMIAIVALPKPDSPEFLLLPGANVALAPNDFDRSYIENAAIVVYGAVTMAYRSKEAALQAASYARAAGVEVIFDVNYRPNIWPSVQVARRETMRAIETASIVKLNMRETGFLFGTEDAEAAAQNLLDAGAEMVCVTMGHEGSRFFTKHAHSKHAGFVVNVIDVTGSGDAFLAGVAVSVCGYHKPISAMSSRDLYDIAEFSNACGALVTTRLGAMNATFNYADVTAIMASKGVSV